MESIQLTHVVTLMELQSGCIQQISQLIYTLSADRIVNSQDKFTDFTVHFGSFAQYHMNSEGFSKALEMFHVYHSMFLERLLDQFVLTGAQYLEQSIEHVELLRRQPLCQVNSQLLMLHQRLIALEETQLKILQALEQVLIQSRKKQCLQ